PAQLQQRLLQEFAVWETLHRQGRDAANEKERRPGEGQEPYLDPVGRLVGLQAGGGRRARVLGGGVVSMRGVRQGTGTGVVGGPDADTVPQRQERAGAGDQQGGQQARPECPRGAGLALVALAAGERVKPVVPAPLWLRE